jgi:hypothetical protein
MTRQAVAMPLGAIARMAAFSAFSKNDVSEKPD